MHDGDEVGLVLLAREEGMTLREAAELAGVPLSTAGAWSAGLLPRSYTGAPWGSGRMGGDTTGGRAARMSEKGLYDPPATGPLAGLAPAQIENLLFRAVLADLKAGGWDLASISNRSKCELGERLRRETGLPLRSIAGFLRISRSSYEYHRSRLGRDRYAALRPLVREAFEAGRDRYGYRRVHAELRRRGVVASEKRVRRVMREEGLAARRPRRWRYSSYAGEQGCAPRRTCCSPRARRTPTTSRRRGPWRGLVPAEKATTSPSKRSMTGDKHAFLASSGSPSSVMSVTRRSPGRPAEKSRGSREASTSSRFGAPAMPSSPA